MLECYRGLCSCHWGGILSLSLPLCLFHSSSHPSSREPDGYRRRTKHSCFTHTHTRTHSGCCARAPTPPFPSFTLRHFPLLSRFDALSSPPRPLVNVMHGGKQTGSRAPRQFFWGRKKDTHPHLPSRCEVLQESVWISKAALHTHAHAHTRGGTDELTLSCSRWKTWSKCGLLQVLRGEKGAGEEQVKAKGDALRKEKEKENNDGAAGV